jgi:hypothetical protein
MAKAKYKIGTLIAKSVGDEGEEKQLRFGKVAAIIVVASGFSYVMEGDDVSEAISEDDVDSAYRPVIPRQPTQKKEKPAKKAASGGSKKASKKVDAGEEATVQ